MESQEESKDRRMENIISKYHQTSPKLREKHKVQHLKAIVLASSSQGSSP